MKIESLKDLQKLIKLCHATGVSAIEVDGVKMNLELGYAQVKPKHLAKDAPKQTTTRSGLPIIESPANQAIIDAISSDGPTDEDIMNWSVRDDSQEFSKQ